MKDADRLKAEMDAVEQRAKEMSAHPDFRAWVAGKLKEAGNPTDADARARVLLNAFQAEHGWVPDPIADEPTTADSNIDRPLPEDDEIAAAHPLVSGRHEEYAEAMRLVGAKKSKGALVELVTWLLVRIKHAEKTP